ncbi:MAG: YkgJ family cysteine cluster protein [Spirosomataceae bacterium]
MDQISALCISCGMCCDGSLFRHGHLFDQEDKALAKRLGLKIVENEGFLLPCKFLEGHCSIWETDRPKVCEKYFCKPLSRYFKDEITFSVAETKIRNLLKIKNQIMEEAQKIDDLNPLTLVQLCDELDKCSHEDLQRYGILLLLKLELNKRLADFFS